jgi:hypothetical protein
MYPDFSADKLETNCANYTSKYNIYIYISYYFPVVKDSWYIKMTKSAVIYKPRMTDARYAVSYKIVTERHQICCFVPNQQMCQYLLKQVCFQMYAKRLDFCLFEMLMDEYQLYCYNSNQAVSVPR